MLVSSTLNPLSDRSDCGSAHRLCEDFKRDLLEEWKRRGPSVLKKLKPHQLARLVIDALPKELLLSVEHSASPFDGMSAEELQQTLADIRAFRAKQIEAVWNNPSDLVDQQGP